MSALAMTIAALRARADTADARLAMALAAPPTIVERRTHTPATTSAATSIDRVTVVKAYRTTEVVSASLLSIFA
ncbi:MAG: hypothetical protein JNM94_14135 [Phycisphaerae bacterium]|nr:hypothetical protein [Phycisphaerae bacterium]